MQYLAYLCHGGNDMTSWCLGNGGSKGSTYTYLPPLLNPVSSPSSFLMYTYLIGETSTTSLLTSIFSISVLLTDKGTILMVSLSLFYTGLSLGDTKGFWSHRGTGFPFITSVFFICNSNRAALSFTYNRYRLLIFCTPSKLDAPITLVIALQICIGVTRLSSASASLQNNGGTCLLLIVIITMTGEIFRLGCL